MSYGGDQKSRRAFEYANKAAHSYIISDPIVQEILKNCKLPLRVKRDDIDFNSFECLSEIKDNPIEHVVVIDGSFSTVPVREEFPSSEFTFFQFGALRFGISDFNEISEQHFIGPEDISKLKEEFGRLKLAIPTKNITLKSEKSLLHSIRKTVFDFFCSDIVFKFFDTEETETFIETFKWLIFEEFNSPGSSSYTLGSCPHCHKPDIPLQKSDMVNYTFKCKECKKEIYLTDVLRLHELIDEDRGANGIIFMLLRTLEQLLLVLTIKIILKTKPDLLHKTLFIQDGPLAFFGQTAKLYSSLQKLVDYLFTNYDLFLVGLEKHGAFVEHAEEISKSPKFNLGDILILDTKYIYTHIKVGDPNTKEPFGRSTYYGNKLIYKSKNNKVYVATLAMKENYLSPKKDDFRNIDVILHNIDMLKCELYDNAIVPIALANRLVSLSNYPGSAILGKFARTEIK